jgi:hypothetical protein
MSTPTPALDFLRKVQVWQEDEANKTAGLVVIMPESEQSGLSVILRSASRHGDRLTTEDLARRWLIGYRELELQQRVLTDEQRAELNDVISQDVARRTGQRQPGPRQRRRVKPWQWILIASISLGLGLGAAGFAHALAGSANGAPPAAGAPVNPAQQPAQGPLTDLQQFRADWDVPSAASADAGNPAQVVLLQDGLYYPAPWVIPAGDAGWTASPADGADMKWSVHGNQADVTDADGTTWTVAAGQPFVLASNPQAVFRVLRDGTLESMPQPHAITARHHI